MKFNDLVVEKQNTIIWKGSNNSLKYVNNRGYQNDNEKDLISTKSKKKNCFSKPFETTPVSEKWNSNATLSKEKAKYFFPLGIAYFFFPLKN